MPHTHPFAPSQMRHGFTLLELSIVLVVIGLILGGVLSGQRMIRASELNSIVSQQKEFQVSVSTFFDKYNALPGDMPNAALYWPTETNGNANGWIDATESNHAWRHLAKAGMIAGQYTGTGTITPAAANSPVTKIQNVGWSFLGTTGPSTTYDAATYYNNTKYNHRTMLLVGQFGSSHAAQPFLTPTEAEGIDKKIDDGKPYEGNVLGPILPTYASCVSGTSANYTYNVTNSEKVCALTFVLVQ